MVVLENVLMAFLGLCALAFIATVVLAIVGSIEDE